jgi:prepilin-type N-terminal cleavage/methylation domain-containing protein
MNLPRRTRPDGPGRRPRPRRARRGFSLIELMAVLVILSILMVFLVPRLTGMRDSAEARLARAKFGGIGAAIAEYEGEFGDWPPSRFTAEWGSAPNETNLGAETLVLSLWSDEWGGTSLDSEDVVNTDDDRAKKDLTATFGKELFELADPWGNPIAYFHRRDYGRKDLYVTESPETGERLESVAEARKSSKTGRWAHPTGYQLISAGLDGLFGTDDDVTSFGD